ncbi:MAG: Fe-S cluster assembly protein SufD [Myxococcota bacterium]
MTTRPDPVSPEWPTRKREDWKHTSTLPAQRTTFEPAKAGANGLSRDLLTAWSCNDPAASLVFVNGAFSEGMSRLPEHKGLEVRALAREDAGVVASLDDAPMVAHNAASWTDGAHITVAKGALIEAPIEVIFVHTEADRPTETHTRVQVLAGEASAITLVETHLGLGAQPAFETTVTEIAVGQAANVKHVRVQRSGDAANHFGTVLATTGASSVFESHVVSLGAAISRTAVHVPLQGKGAECALYGLYAAVDEQSLDHYTVIDHQVPHCTSQEHYKGVVSDNAVGSFVGRIFMREGAVGSATEQMARVLLLSEKARANARPQLEIDNDDVTAAHGTAIGSLDNDALFYLQARGLDVETARGLMVQGFVQEQLDRLPVRELAEALTHEVLSRLHEKEMG